MILDPSRTYTTATMGAIPNWRLLMKRSSARTTRKECRRGRNGHWQALGNKLSLIFINDSGNVIF